jgi:hypothetical protein
MNITHEVKVNVDRDRKIEHGLDLKGKVYIEHYNKDGVLLDKFEVTNSIKNAGKDSLLNIMFHGSTQITTWYIGLIDATGWTAEAAADTLASHTGWSEFTSYTGSRPAWPEDAAASGAITNSTQIVFAITTNGTLKGLFLCSVASGTSGTLWSTVDFPTDRTVSSGDNFKVVYTVSL